MIEDYMRNDRDSLSAPGYQPSDRDKAIAAARIILSQPEYRAVDAITVARFLLRTLGVSER